MEKCPACGYTPTSGSKKTKIRDLVWQRNKETQNMLKTVVGKIRINVPSDDTDRKAYNFLWGIKEMDDDTLKWAMNIYCKDKMYAQGKGFNFLRAMVQNHAKDRKKLKEAESKMLGKTPKSITDKRKELGYE